MSGVRYRDVSWRFLRVLQRNLVVSKRLWKVNFLVPLLEPGFYIAAFGLGFRALIGEVEYAGLELSYVEFLAPALVASAVMWYSFFETTYGSFVRMYFQKTFDGILATPVSLEEIIIAEMVFAALKSVAAVAIMLLVLTPLGFIAFPEGLLILPVAFLGGMAFAAAGMVFTGIIPTIDMFNLPIFLFITPMFLFSSTFFPLADVPIWGRMLSWATPLYHVVELTRGLALGAMTANPWVNVGYLVLFTFAAGHAALAAMKRRLIK
jgi:lipooligosaccharide transport system permease protein